MAGYTAENLNCPFPIIEAPQFDAGGVWRAQQLIDFAESWSAHFKARKDGLEDELKTLSSSFLKTHGDRPVIFKLPISLLAARISQ